MKLMTKPQLRAIENGFPTGFVSLLAEHESWRKEVYRPMYYHHKWWARRLGSVLRAALIASAVDKDVDVARRFYEPLQFQSLVVFDPFMGSGTTVGEALKLGCRVIGRDINPVSNIMVKAAVQKYDRAEVLAAFEQLDQSVGEQIRALYQTHLPDGEIATVLYYFWVKTVPCVLCHAEVELFKTRIFSRHATPSKEPRAKALCPTCRAINEVRYDAETATCHDCSTTYNPQRGNVDQSKATCPACGTHFSVIEAVRQQANPPQHKLYAKMVLRATGQKEYWPINASDLELYATAEAQLAELWPLIPPEAIQPGYNTNQVLNYNYRYWHQMFNARQLAALALLSQAITRLPSASIQTLFACLLSGCLEFNNVFASFKGEGTGAVRHMFAHHILKPELMPLEANLWGTPKSSGSFSTLFESRVLRMLDYKAQPFELKVSGANGSRTGEKVYDLSTAVDAVVAETYAEFAAGSGVYLSTGDSAQTDLPDHTVDVVLTDPPFFDNVHYSQLADFFYVWLKRMMADPGVAASTTRSLFEVQDTDAVQFGDKLQAVWQECRRVLKPDGLLVFTYHHSRPDGWIALYQSVRQAGFQIVRTHPVKAEMAVAVPIQQAKEPISFDLIIVCRPVADLQSDRSPFEIEAALADARQEIEALHTCELALTTGDVRVILMGGIVARLASLQDFATELAALTDIQSRLPTLVQAVLDAQRPVARTAQPPTQAKRKPAVLENTPARQLQLLERKTKYRAK